MSELEKTITDDDQITVPRALWERMNAELVSDNGAMASGLESIRQLKSVITVRDARIAELEAFVAHAAEPFTEADKLRGQQGNYSIEEDRYNYLHERALALLAALHAPPAEPR